MQRTESGMCLNDKHIDYAQAILKVMFQNIQGLHSTLLLPFLNTLLPSTGALQVMHIRGNHWITVSTIGCSSEVLVFDSLYSSVDQETLKMINKLRIWIQSQGEDGAVSKASGFAGLRCLCYWGVYITGSW